ncbi:hypothetical protein DFQ27_002170 [Actinomortierella ambigua]|uniref:N-acetyltransferase domain-containing protein n=1 Tax=Actinomortierella ambigua TaxID=1343610 RepID=A0A9P6QKX8_9FUNG|nr:hypothetical protein DFQ27_002170 [Actinomortierella ambigua]
MTAQGFDRSEILIRPYKAEDMEQVTRMLIEGFWPVGERLFRVTLFQRSTYLKVALTSCILALTSVCIVIPIWQDAQWSTAAAAAAVQRIVATLPQATLDFWASQDVTTILGLQFLRPQFLVWWLIWTVVVGAVWTAFVYHKCVHGMAGVYTTESVEDDMSDLVGYYQSDEPFPKTVVYQKHKVEMSQAEAKYKVQREQEAAAAAAATTKNYSQFWVACLRSHPQVVMGCGALDDIGFHSAYLAAKSGTSPSDVAAPKNASVRPKEIELRRMSVHTAYRRLGILGMLVDTMKAHARQHGFERIVLSTTLLQTEAIGGYKKAGFRKQRVLMLRAGLGIWFGAMDLKEEPNAI